MSKVILVVDDDSVNLKLAEFVLKQKYTPVLAKNGIECLNYLQDNKPDLILLDIQMPLLSGIQVLERIRSNPLTKDLSVMFLTASNDIADVAIASKMGAIDFIKKPFLPDDLSSRVDRFFDAN